MTILGIDISKWDGNWDATKAKQAGASFVFIKASQATDTDPQFLINWQKAKDAGLFRGAYHYLDYTKPGAEQADYFVDLLKNDPGELPPVIDYELRRTDNDPSAALGFLRDCLDRVTERSELFENSNFKRPMIYTGPGFWVEYGDQTKRDYWIQFPLWNAHWTTSTTPKVPPPWTMWNFWQFTSKGPGEAFGSECLSMDMNRFNGTLNELMEFTGAGIPVVNQNEKFATLEIKLKDLEEKVASIDQNGNTVASGLEERVGGLETQLSTLSELINTCSSALTQRIAAIEKTITELGSVVSTLKVQPVTPIAIPAPVIPQADPTAVMDSASTPQATAGISAGWYTQPDSSPAVPASVNPPAETSSYAICISKALNVRSGPGASNPIIGGLQYGQRVKIISRVNGWAQFEDPEGWSIEAYLSFEPNDPSTQDDGSQLGASSNSYGICNTSGLNVRSGPGLANSIVGGLIYGQRIRILGHQTGWAQIDNPPGWCNESYLSFA